MRLPYLEYDRENDTLHLFLRPGFIPEKFCQRSPYLATTSKDEGVIYARVPDLTRCLKEQAAGRGGPFPNPMLQSSDLSISFGECDRKSIPDPDEWIPEVETYHDLVLTRCPHGLVVKALVLGLPQLMGELWPFRAEGPTVISDAPPVVITGYLRHGPFPVPPPAGAEFQKFDTGAFCGTDRNAVRYDLVPTVGLRRLAETYAYGPKKYGVENWKLGLPSDDLLNRALAHLADHLAHAAWNLFVAMHNEERLPAMHADLKGGQPPAGGPIKSS